MTLKKLPLLASREAALETCGYCPKLCRAACPVGDVEANDALTPWGKMSLAWFQARGSIAHEPEAAKTAWACSGCFACRDRCDHKNPVAETLLDARAEHYSRGLAPKVVEDVVQQADARQREVREAAASISFREELDPSSNVSLLLGCEYMRQHKVEAVQAVRVAHALFGPVRLVSECCGKPAKMAGDLKGVVRARAKLTEALRGSNRLIVLDPGCARQLADHGARTLIGEASTRLRAFTPLTGWGDKSVRWHDPCELGRGLGQFEEPRQVLSRILSRPAAEFPRARSGAVCSGGGGLLPLTYPDASRAMANQRVEQHQAEGGGAIVTGCASSLRRFRSVGAEAIDIVSLMARSLGVAQDSDVAD